MILYRIGRFLVFGFCRLFFRETIEAAVVVAVLLSFLQQVFPDDPKALKSLRRRAPGAGARNAARAPHGTTNQPAAPRKARRSIRFTHCCR